MSEKENMRSLHLEKTGLRCLAISESFIPHSKKSLLAGVVMRRDFVMDGFVFGDADLEGDDATDVILNMYCKLGRNDVSYLLVSGLIISMYNIIDLQRLHHVLKIPVIGISYHESLGLESTIKYHFPKSFETKLSQYKKLGDREKITLHTSCDVFVRKEGCTIHDVRFMLNKLTLQGSIPEPLRVSQLLAKTLLRGEYLSF